KLSVTGNSDLGNNALAGYFTATSTTATSTFAGGMTVGTSSLMVDLSTQRVGIRTLSPVYPLDVNGDANISGTLYYANGVSYYSGISSRFNALTLAGGTLIGASTLTLQTNNGGTTAETILTNGNVGIGTTTPWAKLSVSGGGSDLGNFGYAGYFTA